MRPELQVHLLRVDRLYKEIMASVPNEVQFFEFRADLAGLLVVSMASSYESCVKETLYCYGDHHSPAFGMYTRNLYAKLNSRIDVKDLFKYAKLCGPSVSRTFRSEFRKEKDRILRFTGHDIETVYGQVLDWRNDYAHAGLNNTTVEEAFAHHRFAKHVVDVFDKSLSQHHA